MGLLLPLRLPHLSRRDKVPTFSRELVKENAAAIKEVNDLLRDKLGSDPAGHHKDSIEHIGTLAIDAGRTADIPSI